MALEDVAAEVEAPAVAVSAEKRWYQRFPSFSGRKVSTHRVQGGPVSAVW